MANKSISIANQVAALADQKAKKPDADEETPTKESTLTPEYQAANKKSIKNTIGYNEDHDYNKKIRKFLGLE